MSTNMPLMYDIVFSRFLPFFLEVIFEISQISRAEGFETVNVLVVTSADKHDIIFMAPK